MPSQTAPDAVPARAQRVDAQRNRERILDVARIVLAEQGTQASLRDIARRSGVGLGTLYRHFPTRDALLEVLLRRGFDQLTQAADELAADREPGEALREWLTGFVAGTTVYHGLSGSVLATLGDPASPLHTACELMRRAAGRLLVAAQAAGAVRPDVDSTDLFALAAAVGWTTDQAPQLAGRREHLLALLMDGIAVRPDR